MHSTVSPLRNRGWILAAAALSIAGLACSTVTGGPGPTPTLTVLAAATEPPATQESATQESATDVPETTEPGQATPEVVDATAAPSGDGRACFITRTNGQLHCVDSGGLTAYTSADFALGGDFANDLAVCGTGFAIAYYNDVVRFDGSVFEQLPLEMPEDAFGTEELACDPSGQRLAVVATGGYVMLYDNDAWQTFNMAEYDSDDDPDYTSIVDVALPDDHTVWVAFSTNIARWNGKDWKVFEKGADWEDDLSFTQMSAGPDGTVVAAFGSGLLSFEGDTLQRFDNDDAGGAYGLDVTADRILVGHAFGAFLLDRSGQILESHPVDEKPELPFAATIYSVAIDDAGRLWLGSTYNLLVIDTDGRFKSFRMSNTGMMDNAVTRVAVQGTPPLLPLVQQPTGSLTGTVIGDGKPVANAELEVCTIDYGSDTPCSGDPDFVTATTDAKGVFTFAELPRGRYTLYINKGDVGWTSLADPDGYYLAPVFVDGDSVDVGKVTPYE